ncbi:uncharacterized protein LOC100901538 [Galendromus occidentalis]|uniref:Uncharacterized protein LOC100901538 n=1 Tax=Galendromus occidentalis TaxID=34638 RepID=A0AAJ6VXC1_9ACAR|nr:uncharacterized protein LOC100901538 [Galendromus occidentalis]
MRFFTATAVFVLVSACAAQQCTFRDSGFKQCINNYTNWIQVQFAQTKDLTVRMINAIPEPREKLGGAHGLDSRPNHHHHIGAPSLRNNNVLLRRDLRAVEDNDLDSSSEELATPAAHVKHDSDHHFSGHGAQLSSEEGAVARGLSWQQFKREVVQVIESVIDSACQGITNGVETMTHPGGIHDIRSIVCIYSSVSTVNIKASFALNEIYERLNNEQRPRFEKGLAVPLLMAAKRIGEVKKGMEKEIPICYSLLV